MLATFRKPMSVVVVATLFAAACSSGDDASDSAGVDTGAVTRTAGGDVASAPSPAIVMGFLTTVNKGEIEAGALAGEKATNSRVRDYGRMMVTDHRRALGDGSSLADTAALATPVGQPAVDAQAKHEQTMNTLRTSAVGNAFDSTYIAMMVDGHQDVLARLEGMRGTANSPGAPVSDPVHAHLQNTIEMVRTHLQRAQEIQQALQGGR